MRKNIVVILVVSCLISRTQCAPMVAKNCFRCLFTSNHLRNHLNKSLDTILAITANSEMRKNLLKSYLADMQTNGLVRCRHARAAEARADAHEAKAKRRMAPDLQLCHFKICGMWPPGRKRSARFVHTTNHLIEQNLQ